MSTRLRYTTDAQPGFSRLGAPPRFRYVDRRGHVIRDQGTLTRIRALAIPPAWTDVWICRDAHGHLQATGRDARGRKQYRYHSHWREKRDETKFSRMQAFARVLPRIRATVTADLRRPGLAREKVLATVVQLLEKTLIRVGNEEYARANRSFGLTTLRDNHVRLRGRTVTFEFRGKSGKRHCIDVTDARLARVVRQCRDLPGQELFQYVDDHGIRRRVTSGDVNRYLKDVTAQDFTAKDFRTWGGTVMAATALREMPRPGSAARARQYLLLAIDAVAGMLGNTRSVCRKSYIHPTVLGAFMNGSIGEGSRQYSATRVRAGALRPDERLVVNILNCGTRRRRPPHEASAKVHRRADHRASSAVQRTANAADIPTRHQRNLLVVVGGLHP